MLSQCWGEEGDGDVCGGDGDGDDDDDDDARWGTAAASTSVTTQRAGTGALAGGLSLYMMMRINDTVLLNLRW